MQHHMDGLIVHYSKGNNTKQEKYCMTSHVENLKKYNKCEYNKKSRLIGTEDKTVGDRGNISVGEWEVQTIGSKIGSRMYCTTQGV